MKKLIYIVSTFATIALLVLGNTSFQQEQVTQKAIEKPTISRAAVDPGGSGW